MCDRQDWRKFKNHAQSSVPMSITATLAELCLKPNVFESNQELMTRSAQIPHSFPSYSSPRTASRSRSSNTATVINASNIERNGSEKGCPKANTLVETSNKAENSLLDKSEQTTTTPIDSLKDSTLSVNLKSYKVVHRDAFILHLRHSTAFKFIGHQKLTVLLGCIHIYGYDLSTKSKNRSISIYGSKEFKSYLIETKAFSESTGELQDFLKNGTLLPSDADMLLKSIKENDAILLVEDLQSPFFSGKQYLPPYLFPVNDASPSEDPQVLPYFAVSDVSDPESDYFRQGQEWSDLKVGKRTIVIGLSGKGKSGILKYLVNKHLMDYPEIVYLDADLGQGEFCFPGSIGVFLLKEPIFGPNFTHITEHELMYHLGEVSPNRCYDKYKSCLMALIKYINNSPQLSHLPCVVNTMGIFKGLGTKIVKSTVEIVKPNTVVHLYLEKSELNVYDINFETKNWMNKEFHYDYLPIKGVLAVKPKLPSKTARDRMVLAYLSQMLTAPYHSFNTVEPYVISFTQVTIGSPDIIAAGDILKALNGSLVALSEMSNIGTVEILQAALDSDCYLQIMYQPPILPCLGFGFVRGIDLNKKELYVLSPLSPSQMDSVWILSLTSVSVPSKIFLRQEGTEGEVPYTAYNSDSSAHVSIQRVFPTSRVNDNN